MNGHANHNDHSNNHNGKGGIIILEDLEQEDADTPFVSSNYNNLQQEQAPQGKKGTKRNGGEVKRSRESRDTNYSNSNINSEYNSRNNNLMTNGHVGNGHNYNNGHRRTSISAEPSETGLTNGYGSISTNNHTTNHTESSSNNYLNSYHHQESINGHHSSLSVNNAITVAPSRTTLLEPNVYAGGRPHHHHKKHNHRKHKGRSKSPNPNTDTRNSDDHHQSILNRIDKSILKSCGDWTNVEDEGFHHRNNNRSNNNNTNNNNNHNNNVINNNNNNGRRTNHGNTSNVPYYLPKPFSDPDDLYFNNMHDDQLNLPRLYKPYETVVKTSKQILTDKTHRIALSKDNNDPNSILSEAKRTLTQFGANVN